MLEDPFAAEGAHAIFAVGGGVDFFGASAGVDGNHGIDIAGGECHDLASAEFLRDHALFRAEPFAVERFSLIASYPTKSGSIYEDQADYDLS